MSNVVAIVGGTGPEGRGLARRWAQAGWKVIVGSRDESRAKRVADDLNGALRFETPVSGRENSAAVAESDVVVLAVPFEALVQTVKHIAAAFRPDAVVITAVVPLASSVGDRASRMLGVWQGSAAELVAELVPAGVSVAGAFQTISASLLDAATDVDSDVLVCGDVPKARDVAFALARAVPGCRPIHAGTLAHCRIVESMTALLIGINIRHKVHGAGIRLTGLP